VPPGQNELIGSGQHEWIYGPPRGQSFTGERMKEFLEAKKETRSPATRVFLLIREAFHGYSSHGPPAVTKTVTDKNLRLNPEKREQPIS
jgi:hypothetical protein